MSVLEDTGYRSFVPNGAIDKFILVKLSADNTVSAAGLAEEPIGVVVDESYASGAGSESVTVALLSKGGTIKCVAANAITRGAIVYGRASGKIDDVSTSSAIQIGVALEAATATGDIIEVLPKCA